MTREYSWPLSDTSYAESMMILKMMSKSSQRYSGKRNTEKKKDRTLVKAARKQNRSKK